MPSSERALCDLASLPDDQFKEAVEKVEPTMTQKEVRELIKEIKPDAHKKPIDLTKKARDHAYHIYDLWDAVGSRAEELLPTDNTLQPPNLLVY